ncbi:MAG: flagellar filament capping protein FliD [Alicyclobacillus sp.]|nr:flagellar filament capping protein FliD [Alicyclobacillus sp.]
MTTVVLGGMQSIALMTGTIDFTQIIQQLYQADRAPGDALNQQIQTYQLQKNDWSDLSNLAASLQSALVQLADPSTFQSFSTSVTGTDADAISASAGANATPGTYTINVKAGSYATLTSGAAIGQAATGTTSVTSAVFSQPVTTGTISAQVNGQTVSYTIQSGDTINTVMTQLFGDGSGANGITWSVQNNRIQIQNNTGSPILFGSAGDQSNFFQVVGLAGQTLDSGAPALDSLPLGHAQLNQYLGSGNENFATPVANLTGGQGEMDINGVAIHWDNTYTLQAVINEINASSAGVTAAYDPLTDTIKLTSKTNQPINVVDKNGNLAQALNLVQNGSIAPVSVAGTPWQYQINGGSTWYTSASPTVSNAIPGVTFTINSTSSDGPVTLSVSSSTDNLTKRVQAFADAFNALYSKLQSLTGKGGDLEGDGSATPLAQQYMKDVFDTVPGTQNYAQQTLMGIGINTGSIYSSATGNYTVQVDTDTLVAAFQNDPNEVQALLTGMAQRLNADLTNLTGDFNTLTPINSSNQNLIGIATLQENYYSEEIQRTEELQQRIYDQAAANEQLLSQQFQALQAYQAQMSAQQNALRGMFASLMG